MPDERESDRWVSGECLKRCTWCIWSMFFKDNTRTLQRCRLLNKMKGMKPTRELCLRRRPQTGDRKCLTGPTPEKDKAAKPEAPRINMYVTLAYIGNKHY